MDNKWILIRGLARGNGHWGLFPELLKRAGAEVELHEIPGNGTLFREKTPIFPTNVIESIKSRSEFLKKRKENEKFNLIGISLGGMLALKWAEIYPQDLKRIYVINSSLAEMSPFYHRLKPRSYIEIVRIIISPNIRKRERLTLGLTSNITEIQRRYEIEFSKFSAHHPILISNFLRQLVLAQIIKIRNPISVPVTLLGSLQDRLVSFKCTERIAESLGLKAIFHPVAGHDLPLDDPNWVVDIFKNQEALPKKHRES